VVALAAFFVLDTAVWHSGAWLRFVDRYAVPGPGDPALAVARARLVPGGEAPAVLLYGSSQIREGLSCAALEAAAPGAPCANLAFGGGAPLDVLAVADEVRRRRARRVVVTGLFPKLLHMRPKAAYLGGSALCALWRSGALRRMDRAAWDEIAYGGVALLSDTLRTRDALRALWDAVRHDPRGALAYRLPAAPDRMLATEPPRPDRYFDTRVGVIDWESRPNVFTAAQEQALFDLVAAEGAAGGTVIVIDFPTHPGYETTLPPDTVRHYRAFLERLRARTDLVFVAADALPALAASDFLDFTHLAESGRARVSGRVGEIVAGVLAGRSAVPRAARQEVQRVAEQRP
jgi:hypothetical protein